MDFWSFIQPQEFGAQIITVAQYTLFVIWGICLLVIGVKKRNTLAQIKELDNVEPLRDFVLEKYTSSNTEPISTAGELPANARLVFDKFCQNKIKDSSPLYRHLRAIFSAGYNESQLKTEPLLDNTGKRLTVSNFWLRSILSLFIILGLLGTLFGLAESLSHLSTVSLGNAEFSNESLKSGLETLLGKLGGAFAPSIIGVFLTFVGVLVFAVYQRWTTFPLLERLEYETLTNWIPNLVPTPSQRSYEKMRLTERNIKKVEENAEIINSTAGNLIQNLSTANNALNDLNSAASNVRGSCAELNRFAVDFTQNLNQFGNRFQTSVETLTPFSDSLTTLYGKMTEESSQFQQSIKQTLDDSQKFRSQVNEEFSRQSAQTDKMLKSLDLYETAYLKSRQTTDEKLNQTLSAAETAFQNLAQQNEVFVRGLIESIGNPLREELVKELGDISNKSNKKLDEFSVSSDTKLEKFSKSIAETMALVSSNIESVANKLETLETPVKSTAESIATTAKNTVISMDATLSSFDSRTDNWLTQLKQEFKNQNDNSGNQNVNLENLNTNIGTLVTEMKNLGTKLEIYSNKLGNSSQKAVYKVPTNIPNNNEEQPKTLSSEGAFKRSLKRLKFWG